MPIFRVFNPYADGVGAHHYTADEHERDTLISGVWNDEGIGWFGM